jgi:predicted transglutaminase-like cysteine proteinase
MSDNVDLENYWNNKHNKAPVLYSGRAIPSICNACGQSTKISGIKLDVRTIVSSSDALLQQIIIDNNLKADNDDETILRIQKWVVANIKYIGDDKQIGVNEHWQFPFETIALRLGDCEDGANLLCSLALNCQIPSYKVRVVAGFVQVAPTAPEGGHAYVTYLASDNDWRVIDWCFYQDSSTPVLDKVIFKDNLYYKQVWFSFNDKYSWAQHTFEITAKVSNLQFNI